MTSQNISQVQIYIPFVAPIKSHFASLTHECTLYILLSIAQSFCTLIALPNVLLFLVPVSPIYSTSSEIRTTNVLLRFAISVKFTHIPHQLFLLAGFNFDSHMGAW